MKSKILSWTASYTGKTHKSFDNYLRSMFFIRSRWSSQTCWALRGTLVSLNTEMERRKFYQSFEFLWEMNWVFQWRFESLTNDNLSFHVFCQYFFDKIIKLQVRDSNLNFSQFFVLTNKRNHQKKFPSLLTWSWAMCIDRSWGISISFSMDWQVTEIVQKEKLALSFHGNEKFPLTGNLELWFLWKLWMLHHKLKKVYGSHFLHVRGYLRILKIERGNVWVSVAWDWN